MYEVVVANIGTVHQGKGKNEALRVYREYRRQVLANEGRATAVTLWCEGEPVKECNPYRWEVTDTYGGEANYAWVQRGVATTLRGALKAIRQYIPRGRVTYLGEGWEVRHSKVCRVGFVQ